MRINVESVGSAAVKRALAHHLEAVRKAGHNAVQAEAIQTAEDARSYAPVKRGVLKNSITPEETGFGEARVFTPVEYAPRQEFGFVGRDRLGRNYHHGGKLYMTRAAENAKQRLGPRTAQAVQAAASQSGGQMP